MSSGTVALSRAGALRHARIRWVGVPLLLSGIAQVVWALASVALGGPWMSFFVAMFGAGLGLATFGANHDTAMALALEYRRSRAADPETAGPALPSALAGEVDEELSRDRSAALAMRPSPKVALGLPVVALLVQAWSAWRLLNG